MDCCGIKSHWYSFDDKHSKGYLQQELQNPNFYYDADTLYFLTLNKPIQDTSSDVTPVLHRANNLVK